MKKEILIGGTVTLVTIISLFLLIPLAYALDNCKDIMKNAR